MKKNLQLLFTIFTIFILMLVAESGWTQNAYYDSYKMMRILDLKDMRQAIKDANYSDLDPGFIDTLEAAVDKNGNLNSNKDFNSIILKVNDIYNKIFGFLEISTSKLDELISQSKDFLKQETDNQNIKQKELGDSLDRIKDKINLLNGNISVLQKCDKSVTAIDISNDVQMKSEFNKWDKIIRDSCSSDIVKELIAVINTQFKTYDTLKKNVNAIGNKIENYKTTITTFENQKKLREVLISRDYQTDSEKLKDLVSKKTAGLTVEATKTVPLEVKNEIVTDQQNFNISEAALIQAISNVIISSFKQNVISFAIDNLINENDEVTNIILKNTIGYIKEMKQNHDIALPVILQKVKSNIYEDFDALPDNLFNEKIISKFKIAPNTKLLLQSLMSFTKILKDKKHPVEVLLIAQEYLKKVEFQDVKAKEFQKYLIMALILQRNLRDLSPNSENVQIWISSNKILDMLKNPTWTNLFFESVKSKLDKDENTLGLDVKFEALKKKVSDVHEIANEEKSLLFSYTLKLNKFEKTIEAISKKIDDESIILYFDSFKDIISTYNEVDTTLNGSQKPGTNNEYLNLVESSVDMIKYISSKDYIHLIQSLGVMTKFGSVNNSKFYKVTNAVSEKLALVDGIMNSKTGDELETAIGNVVNKNGGYSAKIENTWSLSIDSYLGLFFGKENIGNNKPFNLHLTGGETKYNFGISVPIGLNISVTPKNWPTFNFLLQILDFTAPVNYRFSDTNALPSEIKFKQLISPGLLVMINPLKKYPIGAGFGIQYMPELRKINETPQDNKSVKFGLFFSYDLPLFYLYKPD